MVGKWPISDENGVPLANELLVVHKWVKAVLYTVSYV